MSDVVNKVLAELDNIEKQVAVTNSIIKRDHPSTGSGSLPHVIELLNSHIIDAVNRARKTISKE